MTITETIKLLQSVEEEIGYKALFFCADEGLYSVDRLVTDNGHGFIYLEEE